MPEGERLNEHPDFRYYVERVTSAPENKEAEEKAELDVSGEMLHEMIRRNKGLINKIQHLQNEIKRTTVQFIPVHEEALEVRKALRTLYPGQPEDRIYIAQYIECLEYEFSRADLSPVDLSNLMTGNAEVDSRILNKMVWKRSDGMDPEELAIMAGQYILLLVANRIMQPYSAPNTQQVAATKIIPPGVEAAPATAQILIGLAAVLLNIVQNRREVMGILEDTLKDVTQFEGMTAEQIIEEAAKVAKPDNMVERFQRSEFPYLRQLIVGYSDDWIANTPEPGYNGWAVYGTLEDIKVDGIGSGNEFEKYVTRSDSNKSQAADTASKIGEALGFNEPGSLADKYPASYSYSSPPASDGLPSSISPAAYKAEAYRIAKMNGVVDKVAAVLQHRLSQKLVCCLVTILGKFPTEQIQLVRFGLSLAAKGISVDFRATLNNMANQLNNKLAEKIVTPMMHTSDRFIREWTGRSLAMVDPTNYADPETANIILQCTPIEELFDLLIYAWSQLGNLLKSLITKFWRRIQAKSINADMGVKLMAESERAKRLLKVVDAALAAIDRGNLCANDNDQATPSEMDDFMSSYQAGLPPPITLLTDEDPYTGFNPVEFTTPNGIRVGGASVPEADLASGVTSFRSAECMERYRNLEDQIKASVFAQEIERDLKDAGLDL